MYHNDTSVDGVHPASPNMYYTTIIPRLLVYFSLNTVMQDFYHQQLDQFGLGSREERELAVAAGRSTLASGKRGVGVSDARAPYASCSSKE